MASVAFNFGGISRTRRTISRSPEQSPYRPNWNAPLTTERRAYFEQREREHQEAYARLGISYTPADFRSATTEHDAFLLQREAWYRYQAERFGATYEPPPHVRHLVAGPAAPATPEPPARPQQQRSANEVIDVTDYRWLDEPQSVRSQ